MGELSHLNSILVVEDDFLIATDLERILRSQGCQHVELTGSCSEALELVGAQSFDPVTVDVKLLDTSCDHLVKVLQERGIPFLYVSGFQPNDHPHLPQAPWLSKPIEGGELLKAALAVTTGTVRAQQQEHPRAC